MINFGFETCLFRSLIYTNWILFSINLGHCFAQFRSETAIMRAEFNDFLTSSGFFWPFMVNFGSETFTFRSLNYTNWIMFSILLFHHVVQFRSKTAIMRAEFNDFSTSSAFFWIFHDQFWVWNMYFWILDIYRLDLVFNPFGSLLFNSDLKLPLWEQNLTTFQIHMRFFGSFMINFGSETCIFRSMIYTDWILFSILLGHYVVQFRSETAIMRAEINNFPTSSAFFWIFHDQFLVWNMYF